MYFLFNKLNCIINLIYIESETSYHWPCTHSSSVNHCQHDMSNLRMPCIFHSFNGLFWLGPHLYVVFCSIINNPHVVLWCNATFDILCIEVAPGNNTSCSYENIKVWYFCKKLFKVGSYVGDKVPWLMRTLFRLLLIHQIAWKLTQTVSRTDPVNPCFGCI